MTGVLHRGGGDARVWAEPSVAILIASGGVTASVTCYLGTLPRLSAGAALRYARGLGVRCAVGEGELPTSIVSPERRWRAASAPLIAGVIGWIFAESLRLWGRPGTSPGLPLTAKITVTCGAVVIGLGLAVLIMRTRLVLAAEGLVDHRVFRVIRVAWEEIAAFEISRPKGLWGGFCVTVISRNGATIDLMSTRAYSRIPSAGHLDELYRISWTLEQAAGLRAEQQG
jgi:hypothetical protein